MCALSAARGGDAVAPICGAGIDNLRDQAAQRNTGTRVGGFPYPIRVIDAKTGRNARKF
ncbi:hypothetical protein SBBP2_1250007 [Burkholderiales bacterium]|nr:hypothetical protein SBBP2_1250007 [Burkholderiales bacterium]